MCLYLIVKLLDTLILTKVLVDITVYDLEGSIGTPVILISVNITAGLEFTLTKTN